MQRHFGYLIAFRLTALTANFDLFCLDIEINWAISKFNNDVTRFVMDHFVLKRLSINCYYFIDNRLNLYERARSFLSISKIVIGLVYLSMMQYLVYALYELNVAIDILYFLKNDQDFKRGSKCTHEYASINCTFLWIAIDYSTSIITGDNFMFEHHSSFTKV